MKHIAEEAKVSIATVSRALANSPKVKQETTEDIQKLAEKMGYVPDPSLSALNAYRWSLKKEKDYHSTLAWLTNWDNPDGWKQVWNSNRLYEALLQEAPSHGYRLEPFWIHSERMPARRVNQILRSRGIQGILLSTLPEQQDSIEFPWEEYAILSLSESIQKPRVHSVQRSDADNVKRAVREMAKLGFRKPVMIVHSRYHQAIHGVAEGAYLMASRELLGETRPYLVGDPAGFDEMLHMQAERDFFDCVISTHRRDKLPAPLRISQSIPWVSINLTSVEPLHPGCFTSYETFARIVLEQITSMILRGDTGIPDAALAMRIQGEWIPLPKG